ncbi:hypothetical protein M5D96_011012, partial [Drosophila gunungcola]
STANASSAPLRIPKSSHNSHRTLSRALFTVCVNGRGASCACVLVCQLNNGKLIVHTPKQLQKKKKKTPEDSKC